MSREEFCKPVVCPDILGKLRRDAEKMRGDEREVLISFLSDPYPAQEMQGRVTENALWILGEAGMKATVLTKAGLLATRDFGVLVRFGFSFGTSLSMLSEKMRQKWEPGAASVFSRVEAIRRAHDMGIRTWVSVEPVLDAGEALDVIRHLSAWVHFWRVGKLNHMPEVEKEVDWRKFARDAKALLDGLGAKYYLKQDLRAYLRSCQEPGAR